MKIIVEDWRGSHKLELPLEDRPYQGVFDASGKQVMKFYDQTGRREWLVDPLVIINVMYKLLEEINDS